MVDYNFTLPQQQTFQAPDPLQNYARLQQLQTNMLAMQELVRKRQEEAALRGITADPSSPEYIQQLARISPELGMRALNMQRQNTLLEQQTRAAGLQATKTGQDIRSGAMDLLKKHTDLLPGVIASDNPEQSWATWRASLAKDAGDDPANVPAAYPGEKAARAIMDRANEFLTRTKPERATIGGVETEYAPGTGMAREIGVAPFNPNAGVPSYPMRPAAAADMQRRAQLYAPDLVNPPAPAARPAAPVNAMSPYGLNAPANAFTQQQQQPLLSASQLGAMQKQEELQRQVDLDAAKKRVEAQVAQEQAMPKSKAEETAKREIGYEKAITGVKTATQGIDEQLALVNELKQHPGLDRITGSIYGRTGTLSQAGSNAQSLLDTIKEQGKLTALLNLKEAGGTLGQVSNAEGEGLKQSIAPLGQTQDTATFQRRLAEYENKLRTTKAKLQNAFEDTYAYRGAKAPQNGFTVTDPTGKVHTFPSADAAAQFKQAAGL